MVGIIDIGGGIRGIYGAGVLDYCIDENINFDACIGVSAGSANLISYICKQKGRNYFFYHDYPLRKEYMSINNVIKTGEYLNLDYIYSEISKSGGENPLDYSKLELYKGIFKVVATNAITGETEYFDKSVIQQDNYRILNASCCIPLVCKSVKIEGNEYFDGGVSDPLPIDYAFTLGCDKLVVILTKPVDFRKSTSLEKVASTLVRKKYPNISSVIVKGALKYNENVDRAVKLQQEGKCIIIAPDDCCGVDTLKFTREGIESLYKKGYNDGAKIKEFIY